MNLQTRTIGKAFAGSVVLVLGLVVGMFSLVSAGSQDQDRTAPPRVAPAYPQNEAGLTYGSAFDVTFSVDEPDLILAYATNGEVGYVKKSELNDPLPSSPKEALTRQQARQGTVRSIRVYARDGVTVIGEFQIGDGSE